MSPLVFLRISQTVNILVSSYLLVNLFLPYHLDRVKFSFVDSLADFQASLSREGLPYLIQASGVASPGTSFLKLSG